MQRRLPGWVGRWPLWSLAWPARVFVLAVNTAWLAAVGYALTRVVAAPLPTREALLSAGLLFACGMAAIEVTRPEGQTAGRPWRTMLGAWTLPLVLALPPWWALLTASPLAILAGVRATRSVPYRLVFTGAMVGFASGAGAWLFAVLGPGGQLPELDARDARWVGAAAAAGVLRYLINHMLVAAAVRLADPTATWRALVSRDAAVLDAVEISCGVMVAGLCVTAPWLVLIAAPGMVWMVARHGTANQMRTLAMVDHKTGVLTAGAWERAAELAVARAYRAGVPVAVLMVDVDDFKRVNDTFGHPMGDGVLRTLAGELQARVRPVDLVGRFGGDEFALLLDGVAGDAAFDIAGRLRQHVADLAVPSLAGELIQVTVSVGVVEMPPPPSARVDVTDLVAAADHALYQSKRGGKDRVCRLRIAPNETE